MDGHQLGAVGKGRFDLNLMQHLRDTRHDLLARDYACTVPHQISNRTSITGAFNYVVGDKGNRFRIVEFDASLNRFRATMAAMATSSLSFSLGVRFISSSSPLLKHTKGVINSLSEPPARFRICHPVAFELFAHGKSGLSLSQRAIKTLPRQVTPLRTSSLHRLNLSLLAKLQPHPDQHRWQSHKHAHHQNRMGYPACRLGLSFYPAHFKCPVASWTSQEYIFAIHHYFSQSAEYKTFAGQKPAHRMHFCDRRSNRAPSKRIVSCGNHSSQASSPTLREISTRLSGPFDRYTFSAACPIAVKVVLSSA